MATVLMLKRLTASRPAVGVSEARFTTPPKLKADETGTGANPK